MTDEPNNLAEEVADNIAERGVAHAAPESSADTSQAERDTVEDVNLSADEVASEEIQQDYAMDTDIGMSSVEEPIADEAAAYEEAEEAVAEDEEEADPPETNKGPVYLAPPEDDDVTMDWYILKVQSNRERSIAEALERKIKVEGLDRYFDQVIVPTEKVTEFKGGKKKVVERKLYPGYIVVHMHINDDTWFAVRETSGVGDFTGAGGKPTPMLASEVSRIVQTEAEETTESPKLDIKFTTGDKVKVKEGNFESFEGEVGSIDEASGRVTVMINIFGRSTPVELEYWQIEAM